MRLRSAQVGSGQFRIGQIFSGNIMSRFDQVRSGQVKVKDSSNHDRSRPGPDLVESRGGQGLVRSDH